MQEWAIPQGDSYFKSILQQTPEGFEIDHLREALKFCKRFRTALDGGAHIGTWTVHLAKVFEEVWAFEPAPDTYECLLMNTAQLRNVKRAKKALGAGHEICAVEDDPTRVGNSGSRTVRVLGPEVRLKNVEAPVAEVVTIDGLAIENLDFLKLDVEGHELFALEGARETIARCQPTIVVELKKFDPPRNGGPVKVVELLSQLGYHMAGGIRNDKVFVPH